jgi:hypothetical protein
LAATPAAILNVPDQILLVGIHRDDRLPGLESGLDLGIDVLELGVPVRVALSLEGLAVGLEAVAEFVEQLGDHATTGRMPHALEFLSQFADAFAGPPQLRLRVAPGERIDQSLQVALEGSISSHGLSASASGPTDATAVGGRRGLQLSEARTDRTP